MKLVIKILHYVKDSGPDRSNWVKVIKDMLNDQRVEVFLDNSGTPYDGLYNLYKTLKKEKPTYVLIMHNDVLPVFNLIPTVERLIKIFPNEAITLFTNNKAASKEYAKGNRWLRQKIWYYTQAYIMPFAVMQDMFEWIEKNVKRDERMSDDERLAMYFYFNNLPVLTTVPSLVEHIGWSSTLVSYDRPLTDYLNNKDHRMASLFMGVDQDPLKIDWVKNTNDIKISEEDWGLETYSALFQSHLKEDSIYKGYDEEYNK